MYLCVAALFAGSGPFTAIAQTPPGAFGWSSAQAYGSAVGNPEQGHEVADAKCTSCHGADGNSPDTRYPKLAGQDPAYLYWQIWAFKTGARRSDIMSGIAASLSDAEAADAASYYARQMVQPDAVEDWSLASLGQRIFFAGAGPGMAPACAMCHGPAGRPGMPMMGGMMGMMMGSMMGAGGSANVPILNGQHAADIIDQLNRFASGERQSAMMMMNRVAAALSETDKKAVAEFLSGLP